MSGDEFHSVRNDTDDGTEPVIFSTGLSEPPTQKRRAPAIMSGGSAAELERAIAPRHPIRTRRLYVRDGVITQDWTSSGTHVKTMRLGDLVADLLRSRRATTRSPLDRPASRGFEG
jgi:hypothetical protein